MLALLLLSFLQDEAARATEEPLALRVNRAIALGVEALRRLQRPDGSFDEYEEQHPGGATAFAAFTLAKSGVRKSDPVLKRALAALAENEFASVYSASAHLLLCEALREPALVPAAQRSLDFLLANRQKGVWAYPWGHLCDSNTQFALLALRAARNLDLAVPEEVWLEALEGLRVFRDESGGFTYAPGDRRPYAGITAAALASLAVLQEASSELPDLRRALARAHALQAEATEWLEERFDPRHNTCHDGTWKPQWQHAYLWALERWCGLAGRERVAGRDWYAEGAAWLLEDQANDGSFGKGLADTCFALLFLRRATITPATELGNPYAAGEPAPPERAPPPRIQVKRRCL